MEFFEFFFSGPNWGWKIFALILLVYAVGDIFVRTANCFFDYRLEKYVADHIDEILDSVESDEDDNHKCNTASKDDVRS